MQDKNISDLNDEERELFQEHAKELGFLFRFYQILGVINDILLLPMFATIIIENFEHKSLEPLKTGETDSYLLFCTSFFMEWLVGLLLADTKLRYLFSPFKIFDLLSSLPLGPFVQGARVMRLIRVIKLFRLIARVKKYNGPGKNLLYVVTLVFAVSFSSAYTVFLLEATVNPAFQSFQDVLWWSFVTITSVGYGDKVPITTAGRGVAILLMMTGVGVCGYISAWLINLMSLEEETAEENRMNDLENLLVQVSDRLEVLETKLDKVVSYVDEDND